MLAIIVISACILPITLTISSTAYKEGELYIAHAPNYLEFVKDNKLLTSELKDVLSTALGDYVEQETTWPGLALVNPFKYAKALFVISLPSIDSLHSTSGKSYPLIMDENIDNTWNALVDKSYAKFRGKENFYSKAVIGESIDMIGSIGLIFDELQALQNSSGEYFPKNLKKMQLVAEKMLEKRTNGNEPHVYWVTLVNLGDLAGIRNDESRELLLNKISDLTEMMKKAYNDDVLVAVVSGDKNEENVRSKRQATETVSQPLTMESLNVADDYNPDFPVIFNIILWFSIALLFSLIAIASIIATMDPGRDSIIYRMTSTRMKKDN